MTTALVTGATGFIGGHLADMLQQRGDHVRCLVRPSPRVAPLEKRGLQCVHGDITRPETLDAALDGVDVVYHLAALLRAPWKRAFAETNTRGVAHLAEACARQPKPPVLVVVSSLAAAGVQAGPLPRSEDQTPKPVSRYGKAKLEGEMAAAAWADRVPVTVVRPPMVFGEGDRQALKVFQMAARGLMLVPRHTERRLSMIHVHDLARALILAAERGERLRPGKARGQGVYFTASTETLSLSELGLRIARLLNLPRPRVFPVPDALTWLAAGLGETLGKMRDQPTLFNLDKAREACAGAWRCSTSKASSQLGFNCQPLSLRLRQTGLWYRSQGWM